MVVVGTSDKLRASISYLLVALVTVALSVLAAFFWHHGYHERTRPVVTSMSDAEQVGGASLLFLMGGVIAAVTAIALAGGLRGTRHAALVAAIAGNLFALFLGVAFLLSWRHDLVFAMAVPLALAALGTLAFWAILSRYAQPGMDREAP